MPRHINQIFGQISQRVLSASRNERGKNVRKRYTPFANSLFGWLNKPEQVVKLSAIRQKDKPQLFFMLKVTLINVDGESQTQLIGAKQQDKFYSLLFAEGIYERGIREIVLRHGTKTRDLLDLIEKICDVSLERPSLRDFAHPRIEIHFKN